jgi:murein DD-endopeptidase MepM/ murein hydrolase activator NlpD
MKKFNHKLKFLAVITIAGLFCFYSQPIAAVNQEVDAISGEISSVKEKLEDLKRQSAIYQKNIRQKQDEAMSLKNQLDILTNQIAKSKLDLEATSQEIKKTQLEIEQTNIEIQGSEDKIAKKKSELSEILRQIHQNGETDYLEIFILNKSVGDFFSEYENTKNLSTDLNLSLGKVKELKAQLVDTHEALTSKETELQSLVDELELEKVEMEGQLAYKETLLLETQESENKFTNLYWQVKQEQDAASSNITALEKQMRSKLAEMETTQPKLTDSTLNWPVPESTITSTFHDPNYPFRYLFEHPAIDIRAGQGTTLRAAADGYVLTAKDAGMGYSYIAIMHANGISTVYGHVSKIYVKADEYVSKGEVIGLTGGMPGTPGAGRLCTGPHLHFEVRLNGIPVDPQLYLP